MKITLEHLGHTVSYGGWERLTIEGFERHGVKLYAWGIGGCTGERPKVPSHPDKSYFRVNGDDSDLFRLVEEAPDLPASIEPLMKEFGRHEKQTRALVAAILKEVKENTR